MVQVDAFSISGQAAATAYDAFEHLEHDSSAFTNDPITTIINNYWNDSDYDEKK